MKNVVVHYRKLPPNSYLRKKTIRKRKPNIDFSRYNEPKAFALGSLYREKSMFGFLFWMMQFPVSDSSSLKYEVGGSFL